MFDLEIITREELLRRLAIGDHKLAQLRAEGLPTMMLGERDLRFCWSTVVAWLERHKAAPGSDRPPAPSAPAPLAPYRSPRRSRRPAPDVVTY
jgi:hypothetical protein